MAETAYIIIEGLAPDIAGLSKLFPAYEEAELIVDNPDGLTISPEGSGNGFQVNKHEILRSRVHGLRVHEALKASSGRFKENGLNRIAGQLNAAGLICDPEYIPIKPISWGIENPGGGSYGIPDDPNKSYRKRTSHGRVEKHLAMAKHIAKVVSDNETAERVLYILNTNPGWVGMNIILEAIAWHENVKPENLYTIKLAPEGFVKRFKNAANNARDQNEDPRHFSKPDGKPNKSKKISLWEARAIVREIIHYWIFDYLTVEKN